ncbi:MAG: hypothetical protein V4608_03735 [Bacteroidota bacterium]
MKKTTLYFCRLVIALIVISPFFTMAQQVNFKVLKDDPKDVNNMWLYLDVAQMDFSMKNIHGSSFNAGLWGTADYKERIGGEFILRYGYLTFGRLTGAKDLKKHHQYELGASYALRKSAKTKNTNVILSQKTSYVNGKEVTVTKSIKIPATRINTIGARAGLVSIGGLLGIEDYVETEPDMINYSMTGIYAGLFQSTTHNIFIDTDTDGKAAKSKRFKVYADLLLLPVQKANYLGIDYKPAINAGMIGWRFAMQVLPMEKRKIPALDVKTNGFSFGAEVGMRPYDGLYIAANWSICLLRQKAAILGYAK